MKKSPFGFALFALGGLLLACWLGTVLAARDDEGDGIDEGLGAQADLLLHYLEKQKYVNVGVLRFRAGVEGQPFSFQTGPINLTMANRLENWLLKRNATDQKIHLLRDPGGEAALKREKASYLTPKGIEKLFSYTYHLLVEPKAPVSPDAFVCGLVQLSKDRKKARVSFEIVDRHNLTLREIPKRKFEVKTDPQILDDFSEPYALISAGLHKLSPRDYRTLVVETVSRNRERAGMGQQPDRGESLVQLLIRYNGNKKDLVPIADKPEAYQVEEPTEKDEVALTLRNTSDRTVGVLLAVNGRNTIYQENVLEAAGGPAGCTKWILEPKKGVTIMGFSKRDDKTYSPFRVLAQNEASTSGEDLTTLPNLGAIDLYVFVAGDEQPEEIATKLTVKGLRTPLARGGEPSLKSWDEVAQQMRSKNALKPPKSKGPIDVSPREEQLRLETVKFPNPIQQEHRVIWYYEKPK